LLILDCLNKIDGISRYNIIDYLKNEKNKSSEKPKEIRKFMCVAIACIYYGFSGIEKYLCEENHNFKVEFLKELHNSKKSLNIGNTKLWIKPSGKKIIPEDENSVSKSIGEVFSIFNIDPKKEKINREDIELFSDTLINLRKYSFEEKEKLIRKQHKNLVKRLEKLKV